MNSRQAHLELLIYLVSSATKITGEPTVYAPLRLIEAAQRVCRVMAEDGDPDRKTLEELIVLIEEGKHKNMTDTEQFYKMLKVASEKLVELV